MYEWLESELSEIKTPAFHVIEGPESDSFKRVLNSGFPVPPSYLEFIFRFGNAKLYRLGAAYQVGVRAFPEQARSPDGEPLRHVGHWDDARAYFKETLLTEGRESPVFEWAGAGLRQIAGSFNSWLEHRCDDARRRYGKKRWAEIVRGPQPFSLEEQAVVEARRKYNWRMIGLSETGALRFEVQNGSPRSLKYLTIGVRTRDARISGAVWLPVSHIAPGGQAIIEKEAYKSLAQPDELEAFALPEPGPQDRDRYWEFRT